MKSLLTFLLTMMVLMLHAQNADPYLSIQTNPSSVAIGSNSILEVIAGNAGNSTIAPNSLSLTITVGSNAQIVSFSDPLNRWKQQSLSTGACNSLVLVNAVPGSKPFTSFDLSQINVIIKGVGVGSLGQIIGTIKYLPANNILRAGNANEVQGNANVANDNSSTTLTVISN